MKLLRLVPPDTHVHFIQWRYIAFAASGLLIALSILLFLVRGLNFGIDFSGGTLIEIETPGPADLAELRRIVGGLDLGEVKIQEFGAPTEVSIFVEAQTTGEQPSDAEAAQDAERAEQAVANVVRQALDANFVDGIIYKRIEVVGPKVSGELVQQATLAVVLAVALMLVYIWFRFEWQFSLGAVLALVHDVILTIGVFSVLQLEFNLSIIAALLTIVGYSMNDTVIVYDRVRENLRKYKKMDLGELIDLSINNTLSRTIMTSGTTLLALFSLYFFGGEVIRGFVFAMIWGIFVGTYSSIYVAAPILLLTDVTRDWSGAGSKTASARP